MPNTKNRTASSKTKPTRHKMLQSVEVSPAASPRPARRAGTKSTRTKPASIQSTKHPAQHAIDLSFMRLRTRDEGGGIDSWTVEATDNYTADCRKGSGLAREFMSYIGQHPSYGNGTLLAGIVDSMVERRSGRGLSGLEVAFLNETNRWAQVTATIAVNNPKLATFLDEEAGVAPAVAVAEQTESLAAKLDRLTRELSDALAEFDAGEFRAIVEPSNRPNFQVWFENMAKPIGEAPSPDLVELVERLHAATTAYHAALNATEDDYEGDLGLVETELIEALLAYRVSTIADLRLKAKVLSDGLQVYDLYGLEDALSDLLESLV